MASHTHAVVRSRNTTVLGDALEDTITEAHGKVVRRLKTGTFARLSAAAVRRLRARGLDVLRFPDPAVLELGGETLDVRRARRLQRRLGLMRRQGWTQFLVHFDAPPQAEWLQRIEASGLRVAGRLGTYSFVVEGDTDAVLDLPGADHVALVAPYQARWRISKDLKGATGPIRFLSVTVCPARAAESVAAFILGNGGQIDSIWQEHVSPGIDQRVVIAEADADLVAELAARPDVRWIEQQPAEYVPLDERSAQIVAGNLDGTAAPNTVPNTGYAAALAALGINGTGTIVAINDTGVDTNTSAVQPDLDGKFAFGPTSAGNGDTNGHGTHVAGIAVGDGTSGDTDPQGFLLGQGVAPGAQYGVVTTNYSGTSSIGTFSELAEQGGADVMNCSFKINLTAGGAYSTRDVVVDQAVRDADMTNLGVQPLPIVLACGNSGPGANSCNNESKNGILVGNSHNARPGEGGGADDDIRSLRASSSRGPTADGRRMQPTIVAPGTDIISTRPTIDTDATTPGAQRPRVAYTDTGGAAHADHYSNTGTSMAAPHVSGLCALLTEWWRDRTGGATPSPALLKALLVNGAVDCVGGSDGNGGTLANIPNNDQGWGRANLNNMVLTAPAVARGPKVFVDQRHAFNASDQTFVLRVAVADPSIPMRVSLTWTDPPGTPGASRMLINDLDLEVRHMPSGDVFLGNVFANGFSTTGGDRDDENNVECVYLEAPTGEYEITVRATDVTTDARPPYGTTPWQDFALVVDNAERAASDPIDVVTCLDRSGSMQTAGYVGVTRTTATAFVDRLRIDDRVGVVSFGSSAIVEHAAAGSTQTVTSQSVRDVANAAVNAITFGGLTDMGAGITAAAGLLSSSARRGIVMMSDGYDNGTPGAMSAVGSLPMDLPVYTCAMGPLSDQALLEQIANATGGRYFFMPTIDDLFEIHNYLSGALTGDSLVTNESALASSSRVSAWIDPTCRRATFQVAWANTALRFVSHEPRKPYEMQVRLRAPNGKLIHPASAYVRSTNGPGYVVFHLEEPAPGRWWMEVSTARDEHTRYTAAAFVDSDLRLNLDLRRMVGRIGSIMTTGAQVLFREQPVLARVNGVRVRPTYDAKHILKQFKGMTRDVRRTGHTPISVTRLAKIRAELVRNGRPDPFTFDRAHVHFTSPVGAHAEPVFGRDALLNARSPVNRRASSAKTGRWMPKKAGSQNLLVSAHGRVPGNGAVFQRLGLASAYAR